MRSSFWLFLAVPLALFAIRTGPVGAGEDPAAVDFKFMELRQLLREHPIGEEARNYRFAIGEYYFMRQMPQLATTYFNDLKPQTSGTPPEFLTVVYLLRCAQMAQDPKAAGRYEDQLKEALSSRQFFDIFGAARTQTWNSPLGNHYDFHEDVDHMEIMLNGNPFYTIRLA